MDLSKLAALFKLDGIERLLPLLPSKDVKVCSMPLRGLHAVVK